MTVSQLNCIKISRYFFVADTEKVLEKLRFRLTAWSLCLLLIGEWFLVCVALASEVDYALISGDFVTGGQAFLESDDWDLTAVVGDWDSSAPYELYGGSWALSGGFLSRFLDERGQSIFKDSFSEKSDSAEIGIHVKSFYASVPVVRSK